MGNETVRLASADRFEKALSGIIRECVGNHGAGDGVAPDYAVSPDCIKKYAVELRSIVRSESGAAYDISRYNDMENLAYGMAKEYFKDKVDKGGRPYMGHVESVWNAMVKEGEAAVKDGRSTLWLFYKKCAIVALLHDIIEDTPCTEDDLRSNGFDEEIVNAVSAMTRRPDETYYFDYIQRVSGNDIARKVKVHDLANNMDVTRLDKMDDGDLERVRKYWWCRMFLLGMASGVECNNAIHPDRKFR